MVLMRSLGLSLRRDLVLRRDHHVEFVVTAFASPLVPLCRLLLCSSLCDHVFVVACRIGTAGLEACRWAVAEDIADSARRCIGWIAVVSDPNCARQCRRD